MPSASESLGTIAGPSAIIASRVFLTSSLRFCCRCRLSGHTAGPQLILAADQSDWPQSPSPPNKRRSQAVPARPHWPGQRVVKKTGDMAFFRRQSTVTRLAIQSAAVWTNTSPTRLDFCQIPIGRWQGGTLIVLASLTRVIAHDHRHVDSLSWTVAHLHHRGRKRKVGLGMARRRRSSAGPSRADKSRPDTPRRPTLRNASRQSG
jgi:hypothetical protein